MVLGDLSRTGGRNRALVGASFQVLPWQYLPILSNMDVYSKVAATTPLEVKVDTMKLSRSCREIHEQGSRIKLVLSDLVVPNKKILT